jgi:hypothetical protein
MKTIKQVLRPQRLREVPEQFSWVDQALVQRHLIDRCDSPMSALYLFLITVADAQGLSYYGATSLCARLHLSPEELTLARARLIEIDLIAYEAPLYQVLAIAGTQAGAPRAPSGASAPQAAPLPVQPLRTHAGPVSLGQLLELERRHARL